MEAKPLRKFGILGRYKTYLLKKISGLHMCWLRPGVYLQTTFIRQQLDAIRWGSQGRGGRGGLDLHGTVGLFQLFPLHTVLSRNIVCGQGGDETKWMEHESGNWEEHGRHAGQRDFCFPWNPFQSSEVFSCYSTTRCFVLPL